MADRKPPLLDARMPQSEWLRLLGEKWGLMPIDLMEYEFDPEVLKILPRDVVEKRAVFPVNTGKDGDREVLVLAMADPGDHAAREEAQFLAQRPVMVVVTTHESIAAALAKHYPL